MKESEVLVSPSYKDQEEMTDPFNNEIAEVIQIKQEV